MNGMSTGSVRRNRYSDSGVSPLPQQQFRWNTPSMARIGRPPVSENPTRPISATVEIAATRRFDEVARALHMNRSEAMREAMRAFIATHEAEAEERRAAEDRQDALDVPTDLQTPSVSVTVEGRLAS